MLMPAAFSFGDALLTVIEIALFVAWICLLVYVYGDIFRSHDLSGGAKAAWVLGIFIFPLLGSLIYLLLRGGEMHERTELAARRLREAMTQDPAPDPSSGPRPATGGASASIDELERLAALHRAGSLSDDEFQRAKDRLLG